MIFASLLLAASPIATPAPSQATPSPANAPTGRSLAPAAGLFSAGQLKQKCESMGVADASYCFAYVVGVHDATRAYENWLNLREFCTPPGIVQGELRRAFVDYLAANPGYRSGEAASVVIVALKHRYPCVVEKRKK